MMRPIDLLKRAATLKINVSSESVHDVERVSRETTMRATWSAQGVAALLEGLETEGSEQADVIRVAAAQGGTIVRDETYQVCGYDDDRMLCDMHAVHRIAEDGPGPPFTSMPLALA